MEHIFLWKEVGSLSVLIIAATWALFSHMTQEIKSIREDMKTQSARTDHLYVVILEERKISDDKFSKMDERFSKIDQRFHEVDQKFYDLLKESKGK